MLQHQNMQTGTHLRFILKVCLSSPCKLPFITLMIYTCCCLRVNCVPPLVLLLVLSVCQQRLCLSCKLNNCPQTLLFWMTLPVTTPACFNTGKSVSFFLLYIAEPHSPVFSGKSTKTLCCSQCWSQSHPLRILCDIYVLHSARANGNTASEMFPFVVTCHLVASRCGQMDRQPPSLRGRYRPDRYHQVPLARRRIMSTCTIVATSGEKFWRPSIRPLQPRCPRIRPETTALWNTCGFLT